MVADLLFWPTKDGRLLALEKMADGKLADSPRLAEWVDWMGECFADAWAVTNVGPAYVAALQDFLAPGHAKIGDSLYPPVSLRVRLARAFVTRMGFKDAAILLHEEWQRTGLTDIEHPHDSDLDKVIDALLDTAIGPLGGQTTR